MSSWVPTGTNYGSLLEPDLSALVGVPYSRTAPPSPIIGQTYVDSATGEEYRWNGTAWVLTGINYGPDTRINYRDTAPSSPALGDRYVEANTGVERAWDGRNWLPTGVNYGPDGDLNESSTEPLYPLLGDTYVDIASGDEKRWDGTDWVPTGINRAGSTTAGINPGNQASITTVTVPFPNDDVIISDPTPDGAPIPGIHAWIAPGNAKEQAKQLAETVNVLDYGHAFGANVVLEVWNLPTEPLAPYTVRAGGLEVQYLADGCSWEWDSEQLVVSCDGLLTGVTGKIPGEDVVPWVPSIVSLAGLPNVTTPTTNTTAKPANTIPTPARLNPANPGRVWNVLPTSGVDTFTQYVEPPRVFPTYRTLYTDAVLGRARIFEIERPYSFLPQNQGTVGAIVRAIVRDLVIADVVVIPEVSEYALESEAIEALAVVIESDLDSEAAVVLAVVED